MELTQSFPISKAENVTCVHLISLQRRGMNVTRF